MTIKICKHEWFSLEKYATKLIDESKNTYFLYHNLSSFSICKETPVIQDKLGNVNDQTSIKPLTPKLCLISVRTW